MTDSNTSTRNNAPRKPRRIGHVGQAYLEAVEKAQADKRETAARAMARMAKAAA